MTARRPAPPPPPPTRFGAPATTAVQPKTGIQAKPHGAGYRLVLGAYMHGGAKAGRLPPELAGHGFVAIERPDGRRDAWGFSPKNYGRFDPSRDFGRLAAGVPGQVHDDKGAFARPGVRTRSIPITEVQARAAMAKVDEYRSRRYEFSATRRQCSTFVHDVARAAGVEGTADRNLPGTLYRKL